MTDTCPECGASVEFETRSARVRSGTCDAGHRAFLVLEGQGLAPGAAQKANGDERAEESWEGEARADESDGETLRPGREAGPPCPSCGESLSFRAGGETGVEATCSGCGSTFAYAIAEADTGGPRNRGAGARRPFREGRGGPERPRGRPCRECGGALRFSTGEDGRVTGECQSCGNRFTLPPRRDRDRDEGPRGAGGRFGSRFRPRVPSGAGWKPRGRPRDFGGARASFGRRGPRRDDERARRRRAWRSG
jgi:hypothetical protein